MLRHHRQYCNTDLEDNSDLCGVLRVRSQHYLSFYPFVPIGLQVVASRVSWASVGCYSVLTSSGSVSCLFSPQAKVLGLTTTATFLTRTVVLRKRRLLCTKQALDCLAEIKVRMMTLEDTIDS